MKRVAIPKKKIVQDCQAFGECFGVRVTLVLDTNQRWTIVSRSGGYYHLARNGHRIRLTPAAFDRLFVEEVCVKDGE